MPSAATTASIWDLNLLQVFAKMFLARDTIAPLIFRIRSFVLLWGFALAPYSKTPHAKLSKGLQSGDLGGQISFTYTSVRFFWRANPVSSILLEDEMPIFSYLVHPWTASFSKLFWKCSSPASGTSSTCWCPRRRARSGWRQDLSLVVTYLAVIIVSENPLEAINLSYFHFTMRKQCSYWNLHCS